MSEISTTELQLAELAAESPKDEGVIEAIFIRPSVEEREELEEANLSQEEGVEGDRWKTTCGMKLDDGRSDPRVQITMMNSRVLEAIAGDRSRWSLAGDQLIIDLDVSEKNLPVGQRLCIGDQVVVEVTEVPHTGCSKFVERYGKEVSSYINAKDRASLHLRGIYVMVIEAGRIRAGDAIKKAD